MSTYVYDLYVLVPQIHIENDVGKCDLVAGIAIEMIICRFDDVCYIHMYFFPHTLVCRY